MEIIIILLFQVFDEKFATSTGRVWLKVDEKSKNETP